MTKQINIEKIKRANLLMLILLTITGLSVVAITSNALTAFSALLITIAGIVKSLELRKYLNDNT